MTQLSTAPAVASSTPVVVRALTSPAEYEACVRLQRETWGHDFADYVPASLLKIGQLVGGVTVGAFLPDDRLVGFVYGLTGVRDGRLIHWSHMLAVRADYRNHGLGRRLKEYQRDVLKARGIEMIYWTFDPLVARNAHLNLNRLGAGIDEYVPDMYGDTGSPLHAFGTDRFVAAWSIANGPARAAGPHPPSWRKAPIVAGATLIAADGLELSRPVRERAQGPLLRIEIPREVEAIPLSEACAWRAATRAAFVRLLGEGYHVAGFFSDERQRCFYVVALAAADPTG